MNIFSLEGKNAWVTGASYGIGFNIACAFAKAGIKNIIFNDINEDALAKGLANYKEAGIENVHGYVCDVTNEVAVKEMVDKVHAEVGQIDILVNNAGIIKRIPMHEMKRSEFQQVIDIDLVGPFICASAVIPIITAASVRSGIIASKLTMPSPRIKSMASPIRIGT